MTTNVIALFRSSCEEVENGPRVTALSLSLSLSLSRTHTHFLHIRTHSCIYIQIFAHTHRHTLSHTHTHTYSHTHSLITTVNHKLSLRRANRSNKRSFLMNKKKIGSRYSSKAFSFSIFSLLANESKPMGTNYIEIYFLNSILLLN